MSKEGERSAGGPSRWTCPECGRSFAKNNQRHICQRVTVEDHLEGRPPEVIELYEGLVELVRRCGPFYFAPVRSQIGFQLHRIFAGVRLSRRGLAGYLDIARRIETPRMPRVEPYTKRLFVHHFTISTPEELDEEFAGWVRESYAVGEGRHLD